MLASFFSTPAAPAPVPSSSSADPLAPLRAWLVEREGRAEARAQALGDRVGQLRAQCNEIAQGLEVMGRGEDRAPALEHMRGEVAALTEELRSLRTGVIFLAL
jgi:hypothetical protein